MKYKKQFIVGIAFIAGVAFSAIVYYSVNYVFPFGANHDQVVSLVDSDVVDNSVPQQKNETNKRERRLYKIPTVTLEAEDRVIPDFWRDEVLKWLDYDQLDDDPFNNAFGFFHVPQRLKPVLVPFCLGKYDEAISTIQQELANNWPMTQVFDDIYPPEDNWNLYALWANALEFKGDLEGAEFLYRRLYPSVHSDSLEWIHYRMEFLSFQSREDLDASARIHSFMTFCHWVVKCAGDWKMDEILEKMQERLDDAVENEKALQFVPCPLTNGNNREDISFQNSVVRLYRFRNNCARFVNPTLPYAYSCSFAKVNGMPVYTVGASRSPEVKVSRVLLERKSYGVFLSQMEEIFESMQRPSEEKREKFEASGETFDTSFSREIPDYVNCAMEILRKVGELPY